MKRLVTEQASAFPSLSRGLPIYVKILKVPAMLFLIIFLYTEREKGCRRVLEKATIWVDLVFKNSGQDIINYIRI